jgi:hypothetical protein
MNNAKKKAKLRTPTPKKLDRATVLSVRVGFVSQGTSLNAWCENHGIHYGNANKALLGQWQGVKAKALKTRIIEASKTKPRG